MRNLITTVLVCLAPLTALQSGRVDDQELKELEKKLLAEWDARFEKEEWAIARKKFIAELAGHLDSADRIDLFRLNPERLPEGDKGGRKEFHGYEVLSERRVEAKGQRQEAAAFLGKALHWNPARRASCFNPRHGLRAVSGKRTLDFVICFECLGVAVFEGGKELD